MFVFLSIEKVLERQFCLHLVRRSPTSNLSQTLDVVIVNSSLLCSVVDEVILQVSQPTQHDAPFVVSVRDWRVTKFAHTLSRTHTGSRACLTRSLH
jgi:hypothetical protein